MGPYVTLAVFVLFGATGTYLLLPHTHGAVKPRRAHVAGAVLSGLALLLFALFLNVSGGNTDESDRGLFSFLWRHPDTILTRVFFYAFSLAAIAGSLLTITARNPVYSALWFASVVLSTSGLFLLAGAQFLAAGTVIVYAGAIIVTFLFVIMLAQMEGKATYDRAARAPFQATLTCFLLFWALLYSFFVIRAPSVASNPLTVEGKPLTEFDPRLPSLEYLAAGSDAKRSSPIVAVLTRAARLTSRLATDGQTKPHVAALGETLYSDHLVTVEVAGALLFVALVGALAIATPKRPVRPGDRSAAVGSS